MGQRKYTLTVRLTEGQFAIVNDALKHEGAATPNRARRNLTERAQTALYRSWIAHQRSARGAAVYPWVK